MNPIYPEKRTDGLSSFADLTTYIQEAHKTGGSVVYENLEFTESQETILAELEGTAALSKGCKDAVKHLILSWPVGEEPTDEDMFNAGRQMLKGLGYQKHQAVMAVHNDTGNKHLHICVNKVHPESGHSFTPSFEINKAHFLAREIEIENEWHHDNGNYVVRFDVDSNKIIVKNPDIENTKSSLYRDKNGNLATKKDPSERKRTGERGGNKSKADSIEAHAGTQSFEGYAKEALPSGLFDLLKNNKTTWQDVHKHLGDYGVILKINSRKNGLVFSDVTDPKFSCNASTLNRKLSKAQLESKLGKFEEPTQDYALNADSAKRYDPNAEASRYQEEGLQEALEKQADSKPLTKRETAKVKRKNARDGLYAQYESEKGEHYRSVQKARKDSMTAQRNIEKERWNEFKADNKEWRKSLRGLSKLKKGLLKSTHALETATRLEELTMMRDQERKAIQEKFNSKFLQWKDWVAAKAAKGDKTAESVERGIRTRDGRKVKAESMQPGHTNNIDPDYSLKTQKMMAIAKAAEYEGNLKHITSEVQTDIVTQAKVVQFYRKDQSERTEVFRDEGTKITMQSATDQDIEAGLLVANEKYMGRGILINGNEEFKERAIAIAVKHRIKILNSDLQGLYQGLKEEHENAMKLKFRSGNAGSGGSQGGAGSKGTEGPPKPKKQAKKQPQTTDPYSGLDTNSF